MPHGTTYLYMKSLFTRHRYQQRALVLLTQITDQVWRIYSFEYTRLFVQDFIKHLVFLYIVRCSSAPSHSKVWPLSLSNGHLANRREPWDFPLFLVLLIYSNGSSASCMGCGLAGSNLGLGSWEDCRQTHDQNPRGSNGPGWSPCRRPLHGNTSVWTDQRTGIPRRQALKG